MDRPARATARRSLVLRLLLLPLLATFPAACGGGGGGSQAVRDARPPAVVLAFPGTSGLTEATSLAVSGSASDPDGIAQLIVDGVAAASSDGFATWSARVALAAGRNDVALDVVDGRGVRSRTVANAVLRNETTCSDPSDLLVDATRGRLVYSDVTEKRIVALDLATGVHSILADAKHGKGPFTGPFHLEADPTRDRYLAIDLATLIAIDPDSGARTVLSGAGVGSGTAISAATGLAVDSATQSAYLIHQPAGQPELMRVDLATGDRKTISGGGAGSGPDFEFPAGVALVPGGATALVGELLDDALLAVDLATGARSVLSGASRGSGPPLDSPASIAVRGDGALAWVVCRAAILAVNLVTGDRTIVSDATHGAGPLPQQLGTVAVFDAAQEVLAVASASQSNLLRVDAASGDRSALFAARAGSGPSLEFCFGLAHDAAAGRALVATLTPALVAVDLADGSREQLSGGGAGSGEPIDAASRVELDPPSGRAIVIDGFDGTLVAVDLATGQRTRLSGGGAGGGPAFGSIVDFAVDPVRRLAFVTDAGFVGSAIVGRVVAVDLATGERTIVSSDSRGSGPLFESDTQIQVDPARNRVLVVDNESDSLLAVDLVDGDRTLVSGPGAGSGPLWSDPRAFGIALDGGSALVVDFVSAGHDLYVVDLVTGERALALAAAEGEGPRLRNVRKLVALDEQRWLAADHVRSALFLLDLATGDRVIVSQ